MKPKFIDWDRFLTFLGQAFAQQRKLTTTSAEWDISLGCDKPVVITLASRPPPDAFTDKVEVIEGKIRYMDLLAPCRRCKPCLENRARLWRMLMKREIKYTIGRTWFATFTINPHYRFIFSARSGSNDYLDSYKEISKEFTKYLKRLRKKHKLRYVMVAEAHKDGFPHLHALIHEGSAPIRKKALQEQWPFGFTNFKLVEGNDAAYYVSKYLSKDARTRIRASQKYGQSDHKQFSELITALADSFQKESV